MTHRGGPAYRGTTVAVLVALVLAGALTEVLHLAGLSDRGRLPSAGLESLGAASSRIPQISGEQSIVRAGPYRWVRHPGYANPATGSWLAALICGLLLAAVYYARYYARTVADERMLVTAFGPEYRGDQAGSSPSAG